ncbi:MAG: bifunctional 3-(3-hydroxy-phenyl)propionate/3-hydroxycinnamic acid hydroxylase [Rhodoferax sp.]|nr:bifunctional 3-(3-hydroxy-phenyl)propionate/3-hydroxycinnamic acid hydroxylase [Rhodoferax sp.]
MNTASNQSNSETALDAEVILVGYGPTAVAAANFLGAYGIKTIAFERYKDIYARARAVTVNDWTMRCFQSVGLDADLLKDMDPTNTLLWKTYSGKELMRINLNKSTLGQPASSMIYQPVMEQTLRTGVEHHACVDVQFGKQVTHVSQDAHCASVEVADVETGVTTTVRARYVLACDGGSSGVRTQLDIPLIGSTINTLWVVIDARVKKWWPERHILKFWSDKQRPVVDIPLSLGNHRWEFPLSDKESEKDFETKEQLWKMLSTMGITPEHVEIHQHAFYRHHVRRAARWREGRVFLLGDAAHMMPPWAGQGMQSGIRDSFNLCWKLREVIKGRLPESVLDTYESERAPNVAMITDVSEELGRVIKMTMTGPEKIKAMVGGLLSKLKLPIPPSPLDKPPTIGKGWITGALSGKSAVGQMIAQPRVSTPAGHRCRLDDLLGHDFVMLGDEVDPASLLSVQERKAWDSLGTRYIAVRSAVGSARGDTDIMDMEGTLLNWLRQRQTKAVVVRPDRFVAAAYGTGLSVPK